MKAYVFIKTLDFHSPKKCVWRGNIDVIPADGSGLIFDRHGCVEHVEFTYYDVTKNILEIHMEVTDVHGDYKGIKRYWSRWPHWWPIQMHSNRRVWYKWLLPRRMTLKSNPRVHRWLLWVW